MPELPEVETVRRGLLDKVLNRVYLRQSIAFYTKY